MLDMAQLWFSAVQHLKKISGLIFELTYTHEVLSVLGSDEFSGPFFHLGGNLQRQR